MLQIRDLTYNIGDRKLLSSIDWIIPAGKKMALIGANGTGKTTLLKIITEELEHHGGSITVQSEIGRGTKFIVTLPVKIDD